MTAADTPMPTPPEHQPDEQQPRASAPLSEFLALYESALPAQANGAAEFGKRVCAGAYESGATLGQALAVAGLAATLHTATGIASHIAHAQRTNKADEQYGEHADDFQVALAVASEAVAHAIGTLMGDAGGEDWEAEMTQAAEALGANFDSQYQQVERMQAQQREAAFAHQGIRLVGPNGELMEKVN